MTSVERKFIFQSTLPRRERLTFIINLNSCILISIHAPAKGATRTYQKGKNLSYYFNPRSREGSDLRLLLQSLLHSYFNPRSREGSDSDKPLKKVLIDDFNPRSREGSDYNVVSVVVGASISIHAPAKGATKGYGRITNIYLISIHAPAKGATRYIEYFTRF